VGRFETINEDWETICKRIDIDYSPLAKVNPSGERKHYSEYYSDEMVEKVRGIYGRDSDQFAYEFDDQR